MQLLVVKQELIWPTLEKFEILDKIIPEIKEDLPLYKTQEMIKEFIKTQDAY